MYRAIRKKEEEMIRQKEKKINRKKRGRDIGKNIVYSS